MGLLDQASGVASEVARRGKEFLATEEGRALRHRIATGLIFAAPVLGEFPVLRRTAMGRLLRIVGVSAILIKGAEWLRDWDPVAEP